MHDPPEPSPIRSLRARAVDAPLAAPIRTAGGDVTSPPLILVDLTTAAGDTGRAYLFCYTRLVLRAVRAVLEELTPLVVGADLAPRALDAKLRARFRLVGWQGVAGMALAGIEMAAWDALASARGVPLCTLLGATPGPVPAYDSHGVLPPEAAGATAARSVAAGFRALKFKLGSGSLHDDVCVLDAVRGAVGDGVALMVDYNQSLGRAEAIRRGRRLAAYGLSWIEEPCTADDDASHAAVAAALDTPLQLGENWWRPAETARALAANACDEVMLDVMKIGGVSAWIDAAGLAAASGRAVSSHIFPEFSAHLLRASASARYLEWIDLASAILAAPLLPRDGTLTAGTGPGVGLRWNEEAVERCLVS